MLQVKDVKGQTVASGKAVAGQTPELPIADPKLWSPESPFLYADVEVTLYSAGKAQDKVKSYTAMRKVSFKRDDNGIGAFATSRIISSLARSIRVGGPMDYIQHLPMRLWCTIYRRPKTLDSI